MPKTKDIHNVKKLIKLIKDRPIIWDSNLPDYKDKYVKDRAWKQVYSLLCTNYNEMDNTEKHATGLAIMRKWCGIRDAYRKSLKLAKINKNHKPYIYAKQLDFLNNRYIKTEVKDADDSNNSVDSDNDNSSGDELVPDDDEADQSSGDPTRKLIELIRERPVIWDRNHPEYRERTSKSRAWKEIYRVLEPTYDSMDNLGKHEAGIKIMRRWYSVRDSYVKYIKKSLALGKRRPYIYKDSLAFLKIIQNQDDEEDPNRSSYAESQAEDDETTDAVVEVKPDNKGSKNNKEVAVDQNLNEESLKFSAKYKGTEESKKLIKLIEKHPSIWNPNDIEYRDKFSRRRDWKKIYRALEPNFNSMDTSTKQLFARVIHCRWTSIRDTYIKSLRLSSTYRSKAKPYIYSDSLQFLKGDYVHDYVTPDDYEGNNEQTGSNNGEELVWDNSNEDETSENPWNNEVFVDVGEGTSYEPPFKRYKIDNNITSDTNEDILAVLTHIISKEEDEDRAFFTSITPSVKKLSEKSKMDFRIQVMELIKSLEVKDRVENMKTENDVGDISD